MRGKVAKKIKKAIYGDMSPKVKQYKSIMVRKDIKGKPVVSEFIENVGLRADYQKAKKNHIAIQQWSFDKSDFVGMLEKYRNFSQMAIVLGVSKQRIQQAAKFLGVKALNK